MNQIFEMGRYQIFTKRKKNWGSHNEGFPKRALQNSNFLTTHAGRMKFSG